MAERAVKIYAGERNQIPEIPSGPDADPLWVKGGMMMGGGSGGGMPGAGTAARGSGGGGRQGASSSMPGATAAAGVAAGGAAGAGGGPGNMPGSGTGAGQGGGIPGATATVAGRGTTAGGGSPAGMPGSSAGTGPGGGMPGANAASAVSSGGGGSGGMGSAAETPHIDTAKCIYPRCTACVDNYVVGAIDLSMTSPANWVSGSPIFVKGCIHCGQPMCERSCAYDAITYQQMKTKHVYDMTKCTYPKCTLCIDNCPMYSIDFSQSQPIVHNNCEGCDLCWCICPYNAISISNIADTHARLANSETSSDSPFLAVLNQAEKTGRFRRLMPIDKVGWGNIVYKDPNAPRVVLHEKKLSL